MFNHNKWKSSGDKLHQQIISDMHSSDVALLIYYRKQNRYSFNALVGAIEKFDLLADLPVFFARNFNELIDYLEVLVKKFEKVIVAFSIMTPQLLEIREAIRTLRSRFTSKVLYIAGGPHPTGDPIGTINLGFDLVVRGEGEGSFPEIIRRIKVGENYKSIRGIAFREGKDYVINPPAKKIDLNDYPPFALKHRKFGPIEITRGCPWACRFCQTPYIFGVKVRHRNIENICKYVRVMKKEKLTDIRFISPNAFMYGSANGKSVNINAIEKLLYSIREALGPEGRIFFGTFPSEVRPESVCPEILELIKKFCNNDNLVIGAQSGSERILELIGRGHSVDDIRRAVKLTIEYGLKANVDFIFGLPGETEEDIRSTLKLIKELTDIGARIHAHTFMPLVGTPFKNMPAGKITPMLKKELGKLASKGKLYGQWQAQQLIAKQIEIMRRKRLIRSE